jgi:hypothetical protein
VNIFILSNNPKTAAQYHNDKHCIKMILEHTQLLCTAVQTHCPSVVEGLYKITHLNHPCSKWTRESRENFLWLCEMTEELFQEYTRRYDKHHKSYAIFKKCMEYAEHIPSKGLTPFAQAMPDQYKDQDAVKAYRTYYLNDKKDISKWKTGNTPEWWII